MFKVTNADEIYKTLNNYDILLFPTRWAFEGVPGILVESKIAGLTVIASNIAYNNELIINLNEGIILENNDASNLCNSLKTLDCNRDLLFELKTNNYLSSERYYIDNYIDNIIETIK